MTACVYIKDGNIHLYSESNDFSNTGGIAYELGRPLLDFVCYEPERFDEGFSVIAEAFDNEFAHVGAKAPEFISGLQQVMTELQQKEIYLFFYPQMLMDFIYGFIDSPWDAVLRLSETIPTAVNKLQWVMDFEWPASESPHLQMVQYADKEKRLFRAVKDAVALMCEDVRKKQQFMINEVELLLSFREAMEGAKQSSLDCLYWLEEYRMENTGCYFYLENPFRTFYGSLPSQEIVQLYEVSSIDDLFRFEFIKMIENDIFIKKCKNCERFFMPRRRVDAEYCDRIWGDGPRKCSEIGATLRYEKKVSENPILEAHKKAYRRFNSRARTKKMTQHQFMAWAEEATKKRDACLAGDLPFDEYIAWLEQGRVRKARSVRSEVKKSSEKAPRPE